MTRKTDQLPKGFAWCTKKGHLVWIERFYRRKSGRLSSWCIDCSNEDTKQKKEFKTTVNRILSATPDLPPEKGDVQEIKHFHIAMGSAVKESDLEVPEFPSKYLDWLTPLYGKQDRSKLEQQGDDED